MTRTSVTCAIAVVGGALLLGAPAQAAPQKDTGASKTTIEGAPVSTSPSAAPLALRATDSEALEERWGIQIQGLHLTAAGYMLDFRYKVVDPAKAAPLFERKSKPLLKDEKTGAVMAVPVPPKTGALRSSNDPKEGRTYFMFFANPGQFITLYSRVTVTIGEFSVSGLTVK